MINYVIAKYCLPSKQISSYMEVNQTIFTANAKDAYNHARRISKLTGEEYRVFQLFDVGTYYDPDPC